MKIKKYSFYFLLNTILITVVFSLFNYIVDPYLLFETSRFSGFNDKKPTAENRSTLYKPYNVSTIMPKTIVVGNSRPEMGIDPTSSCWPDENRNIYSLTFPGLGAYGQVRALYHAVADNSVKNILFAVDFSDFLHKRNEKNEKNEIEWPNPETDFYQRLFVDADGNENKQYQWSKVKDYAGALFSLDTLIDSVSTTLLQTEHSVDRTTQGFNPANNYNEIIKYEGAWVLFKQKHNEIESRFSEKKLKLYDTDNWSVEFEGIKRVINLALKKNIQLIIFINPYHYTYLEVIRSNGYWDEFENFKRSLTGTIQKYGNGKVKLWDFSLYSSYTTLAPPSKNEGSNVPHWFWEPAHYKKILGNYMLADIYNSNCVKAEHEPIGVELNSYNIEQHLLNQNKYRSTLKNKKL